jgi:hypothetical protein
MARVRFAAGSTKSDKAALGRQTLERTPLVIRSPTKLGDGFENRIRAQVARRIGQAAGVIERITVRFDDVNGPKGGVDAVSRIKVVMTGRPSVVVEKRADSYPRAFVAALGAAATAVRREQGKHDLHTGRRASVPRGAGRGRARSTAAKQRELRDAGELIGRRVGHGPAALSRALDRPEKRNRAAYTNTAAKGVSASDRRAGGPFTARRNTMAQTSRATAMLEDSATRPSRKSTRRSANRGKPSQTKERANIQRLQTPASRAARRG